MTQCPCCGAPTEDGKLLIDLNTNIVAMEDRKEKVQPKLAELLFILAQESPKTVTREKIMDRLYGSLHNMPPSSNSLSVQIANGRGVGHRIGFIIETAHCRGYRLRVRSKNGEFNNGRL